MANYNIEMSYYNGNGYDTLYPENPKYLPLSGGKMTGSISMGDSSVFSLNEEDELSITSERELNIHANGGLVLGSNVTQVRCNSSIQMNDNSINNLGDPISLQDAVNLQSLMGRSFANDTGFFKVRQCSYFLKKDYGNRSFEMNVMGGPHAGVACIITFSQNYNIYYFGAYCELGETKTFDSLDNYIGDNFTLINPPSSEGNNITVKYSGSSIDADKEGWFLVQLYLIIG